MAVSRLVRRFYSPLNPPLFLCNCRQIRADVMLGVYPLHVVTEVSDDDEQVRELESQKLCLCFACQHSLQSSYALATYVSLGLKLIPCSHLGYNGRRHVEISPGFVAQVMALLTKRLRATSRLFTLKEMAGYRCLGLFYPFLNDESVKHCIPPGLRDYIANPENFFDVADHLSWLQSSHTVTDIFSFPRYLLRQEHMFGYLCVSNIYDFASFEENW